MIFLDREQRSIMIPKHINCAGPMTLTLKHNLTNTEYVFDNLPNDDTSILFWNFNNMDFTGLPTGEYNYYLNDVEYGLLVVTSTVEDPISYDTEKTIVQYGD